MRRLLCAIAAAATLAGACGSDPTALEQTEQNMAKLKSATLDLRYAASAGSGASATGPVGFRLKGPFSLAAGKKLAVFDLTYTRLLGGNARVTAVRSTGTAAYVETGGEVYRVPSKDLASLRIADDASGGVGGLGIAGWVEHPTLHPGATTDRITGDVDAADLLSDIARIAAGVGGEEEVAEIDHDAAQRLRQLVKASKIEVVTGHKDRQLRSLSATIDFGTRAPNELRRTLGKYANAHLEIHLSLRKLSKPLRVAAPENSRDL